MHSRVRTHFLSPLGTAVECRTGANLEDHSCLIVAEKLKQEGRHEIFEQETTEELEDEEGNVYNRKTYEDLKKQGLI